MKIWYTMARTGDGASRWDGEEWTPKPSRCQRPSRPWSPPCLGIVCLSHPPPCLSRPRPHHQRSPTRSPFSPHSPTITLAAHRTHSSRRMVQCHFDEVIAHEKAIIPYPTPPLVEAPSRLLLSTAQNLPNDFAAALFFDTRRTLKRTVFDSGRH